MRARDWRYTNEIYLNAMREGTDTKLKQTQPSKKHVPYFIDFRVLFKYKDALVSYVNYIYVLVPGVNSSVENPSCPESTRRCSQCVIPLSWCQSVLTEVSWPSDKDVAKIVGN